VEQTGERSAEANKEKEDEMGRKTKLIAFFWLFSILCSGCWSSHEINTLGISIATGIDLTEGGYTIYHQVLNPKAITGNVETIGTPVFLFTQQGDNLFSATRKISLESPRKIYNAHLRMIIFGEEMARNGIKDAIDFYMRDYEFRTDFYFAVARNKTAKEVLELLTPLEFNPGIKMYESLKNAQNLTGLTKEVNIIELTQLILADGNDPVLPGIDIVSETPDSDNMDAMTTVNKGKRLFYNGLGVFNEDKLIGWLSGEETLGLNYILGNIKKCPEYVYYNETDQITFDICQLHSKISAVSRDEKPEIHVKINIDANIAAMEGDLDISKKENQTIAAQLLESKIQQICQNAVRRAQHDFRCDIFGFGEIIYRKYPDLWKKLKTNWSNEFSNIFVDFHITVELKQPGQITKPMFRKEK
jgi:spore germination protein KC